MAIIGAGNMGRTHAAAYTKVRGAKPVMVVDIVEEKAKALQESHQVAGWCRDYREAVRRSDVDMVDVCVPTWLHEEVTVAAAEAGKHVLCEKPMSLSLSAAKRMQQAADGAGVALMIAFCRRYDNAWMKMRELVQGGALGRPVVWRSVVAVRGGKQPWFVQEDQGGGPLVDAVVHNYDFARYVFGEVKHVAASTMTFRDDATAVDTGSALIHFASGDDLVVSWSWGLPQGARGGAVNDIIGPKGALYFGKNARPDFAGLPALGPGYGAIVVDGGEAGIVQYPYEKNDMYRDEIQAFVDAVHEGRGAPVSGEDGIKSLAVARAVLQAGEHGQIVVPCESVGS